MFALFLSLLVGWVYSQTPQPTPLPGTGPSDSFTLNPCSYADLTWTVPTSAPNRFFFEIELTPGAETLQSYSVSLHADASFNCPLSTCTAQTGTKCKVGIACGAKKQTYYIRVTSLTLVENGQGSFIFTPTVTPFPEPLQLPLFENKDVPVADNMKFTGVVVTPTDVLSKYQFLTFTVPAANDKRRLRIETTGTVVEHYLQKDRLAYPGPFGCTNLRVAGAALSLSSCEIRVGGVYHLTVERTGNFEIKAYYEMPEIRELGIAKQYEKMFKVEDIVYFRYSGFKSTADTTFVSVIDNVAGGSVLQAVYYKDLPFQDCAADYGQCNTAVSCHVTVHPCTTRGKTVDVWWVGVKVITMDDEKIPVSFTVSVVLIPNTPKSLPTSGSHADTAGQGQFKQYKIETSTLVPGDWIQIEFYIDASHNVDIDTADASLYLRDQEYAGDNTVSGCFNFVNPHTCTAVETSNGRVDVKSCSIQLDPCELNLFPNGIWVGIHPGGLAAGNNYHWFQDLLYFTLKTKVWNANRIPGLLTNNIDIVNDVVAVGQTNIYRVNSFQGVLSVGISAADTNFVTDNSINLVRLEIILGSSVLGPSCDCWLANVFHSHDVPSTTDYFYKFADPCTSHEEGIFIAVTGLGVPPTVATDYDYFERQYTLSVKKQPTTATEATPLEEGFAHVVQKDLAPGDMVYRLEFPRVDLTNKVLVVKGRAHRTAGFTFQFLKSTSTNLACGVDPLDTCSVDAVNEGYCTIVKDCYFPSATDATHYFIRVTNPGILPPETADVLNVYELWFEVATKPVTPLQSGVTVIDSVETRRHKQFSLEVTAADVATKNLLVEIYFDAGHSEYDNPPATARLMQLFVNTPSSPRTPGSTDFTCYCSQVAKSHKRKIVYHINSCNLLAGVYRFAIYTNQPVYDSFQAKFTMTATLQPAIITTPQFKLDFPIDFKLYREQIVTFAFDLPPSMFTLGTDIDRTLEIKITNNQPGDDVQGFLTDTATGATSSLCSCNSPKAEDTCTTLNQCSLKRDYCQLKQGRYYFIVTAIAADQDPLDTISFSLLISRTNGVKQKAILPITISTEAECTNRVRVSGAVRLNEYQHFSFPLPAQPVEIYVDDIKDGSVIVHLQKDNLATAACRVPGINPTPCIEGATDCSIPLDCAAVASHLSVEASNPTSSDPVLFNISACFNPIGETALRQFAPPPATVSTPGLSQTGGSKLYKLNGGLNSLNVGQNPIISIALVNVAGATGFTVSFTTGACTTCAGGFTKTTPVPCTFDCLLEINWCELPSNYKTADWYVQVVGSGDYDLDVAYRTITATVVPLSKGVTASIEIPAFGWAAARWTPSAADIPPVADGLSRVRVEVATVDAQIESFWYAPPGVTGNALCWAPTYPAHNAAINHPIGTGCCASSVDQIVYFHSKKATAVTFEVTPTVLSLSGHQLIPWTNNRAEADVTVPPTGADKFLKEARINYPGRSHPLGHLYIRITSPATATTTVYYNKNGPAGTCAVPDNCCFATTEASETVSSTQTIIKRRFCDAELTASDLWFGLENANTDPHDVKITAFNVDPSPVVLNVASTFTLDDKDVYYQYYVDLPAEAYKFKQISFKVKVTTGTARVFYNPGAPAGDVATCLTNTDASPGDINQGAEWEKIVETCGFPAGRYFLGVHATVDAAVIEVNVTTKATVIPVPISATPLTVDQSNVDFVLRSPPTLSPNTVMRVRVSGLGATQPTNPDGHPTNWNWFSEETSACTPLETAYCNEDRQDCTYIIYPCLLVPNTNYHFDVPAAPNYVIEGTVFQVPVNNLIVGSSSTDVVLPHDLKFYTITVPPGSLKPGQTLQIMVEDVSCGEVEVWINKDSSAGKYCNINPADAKPCKGPCTLKTLGPCDFLGDDYASTYHITVRGLKAGFQGAAARFAIGSKVTGGASYHSIQTNEIHTLYAIPDVPAVVPDNCPAFLTPITYPTCCDTAPPAAPVPQFKPENVFWHYHIEGAHFLENFNLIEMELADGVQKAVIYLSTEVPDGPAMCNGGVPANIWTQTCTADSTTSRKCTINLHHDAADTDPALPEATQRHCRLRDRRDIFLWVDPASVVPLTLPGDATIPKLPVVRIMNKRSHYSVISIGYVQETKHLQFALSNMESQYIVVEHPDADVISSTHNYRLSINIFDVLPGGSVELFESWDACKGATAGPELRCVGTGRCLHRDSPDQNEVCNPIPGCACEHVVFPCDAEFSGERKSYFRLTGKTDVASQPVTGLVRFKFVEVEEDWKNQCVSVLERHHRYYHLNDITLGPEQIYKFSLHYHPSLSGSGDAGAAVVSVYGGRLAERDTCQQDIKCQTAGTAECEQVLYRHEEAAHASVSGTGTGLTFYTFTAAAHTVPVCPLTNKVAFTSPYSPANTPCPSMVSCNWYKFPAVAASNYMLVEFESTVATTIYLHRGHVTYMWGEKQHACTPGYCYWIIACDYLKDKDFYFHIPGNTAHTLTVSALTVNPTSFNIDQGVVVQAPPRVLTVYKLDTGGNEDDPTKDLKIRYSTGANVDVWVTRGNIGDVSCDLNLVPNAITADTLSTTIPTCNIHRTADSFFVHFFTRSAASCSQNAFSLRAFYEYTAKITPSAVTTVTSAGKSRFKFNVGALTDNDIVYVQIKNVIGGDVSHSVWKSNHLSATPTTTTQFPCSGCSVAGQHKAVSWHDQCWHCGQSTYDTVYVDVTATPTIGSGVTYTATATKTTWVALTDAPLAVTFIKTSGVNGLPGNLGFYKFTADPTSGNVIEVRVAGSGSTGVKLEVFGAECGRRNAPWTTLYCLDGEICQFPITKFRANHGSYWQAGFLDHNLAGQEFRIVVTGNAATFSIRHAFGPAVCKEATPELAPFCATHLPGTSVYSPTSSIPQKDTYAERRYQDLEKSFSCEADCKCKPLTEACRTSLKNFACSEAIPQCSDKGTAIRPNVRLCTEVQLNCGHFFRDVGHPELDCYNDFYIASPTLWVTADRKEDTYPPIAGGPDTVGGSPAGTGPAPPPPPTASPSGVPTDVATDIGTGGVDSTAAATAQVTSGSVDSTSGGQSTGNSAAATTSANTAVNTGDNNNAGDKAAPLSGGAIAGIVIAVILLIAVIAAAVVYFVVLGGPGGGGGGDYHEMS